MIETNPIQYPYVHIASIFTLFLISACTPSQSVRDDEIRKSLLGKSHADILSCAGTPVQENQTDQGRVLRYYKEAHMFDESGVFLKGSRPGVIGGVGPMCCWTRTGL